MSSTETGRIRKCPLCGGTIPADRSRCGGGCPMAMNCRILCCPHCGYGFVEDSIVITGIGRLMRRLRRKEE